MDPNRTGYAAYGYGDTGYASAIGDRSADITNQYNWNQWTHQQHQHQHQASHVQQQNMINHFHQFQTPFKQIGTRSTSNYGQKSFPMKTQKQKKFVTAGSVGFSGNTGLSPLSNYGTIKNDWMQPQSHHLGFGPTPSRQQKNKQSFPKKGASNGGNGSGWKNKKISPQAKKLDPTGKTPAMLLHELYKTVTEDYSEVEGPPKKYRCSLIVNGEKFMMESANKKAAKQKCSELVIRTLRPDINVTPFDEGATAKANPVAAKQPQNTTQKRNAASMTTIMKQPLTQNGGNAKKLKVSPLESAQSLLDFFRKLIDLSETKYNPVFEAFELAKLEAKDVVEENDKKGTWRKRDVQHTVTLKLEEQNKSYTQTGNNRTILKDLVIRDALRELFNVSMDDIRTITRRNAIARLGTDIGIFQTLQQFTAMMDCTYSLDVEVAEDTPIENGKIFYIATCKLVDNLDNNKTVEYKSPSLQSKMLAKEYAAQEMLKNYFGIDPVTKSQGEASIQGPCAILHTMLNKQTKSKTSVTYEFKENVPVVAGQASKGVVFYCDCVIDEKDRYTGSGRSKKLAKNNAATQALKKIFSIDYDPSERYPLAMTKKSMAEASVSKLCRDIAEFSKREYHTMCQYFEINPSNQIACFVLVNEKEEKRLVSVGSSVQYVVEPDTLNGANGTVLIHMDPIVIARRALIKHIILELVKLQEDPENSIFKIAQDGKPILKENLKLVLYSNFPPVCSYSVDDAKKKSLAYVTPTSLAPTPDDVLSYESIKETKSLRIHCTADKMYKWSKIGIQGALLSNVIHPMYLKNVYFGSEAPVGDESLKYALFGRLGESDSAVSLESVPTQMKIYTSFGQAWSRGIDAFEHFDYNTGRTLIGSPSKLCKAELFDSYRRIPGIDTSEPNYSEVKRMAVEYQQAKEKFYKELEEAGLGKWQRKPTSLVDDFQVTSFD